MAPFRTASLDLAEVNSTHLKKVLLSMACMEQGLSDAALTAEVL